MGFKLPYFFFSPKVFVANIGKTFCSVSAWYKITIIDSGHLERGAV